MSLEPLPTPEAAPRAMAEKLVKEAPCYGCGRTFLRAHLTWLAAERGFCAECMYLRTRWQLGELDLNEKRGLQPSIFWNCPGRREARCKPNDNTGGSPDA